MSDAVLDVGSNDPEEEGLYSTGKKRAMKTLELAFHGSCGRCGTVCWGGQFYPRAQNRQPRGGKPWSMLEKINTNYIEVICGVLGI